MKNTKIIIYDNDGDSEKTEDSLFGVDAKVVHVNNDPEEIEKESLNGGHDVVILTDNRNHFTNKGSIQKLVSESSLKTLVCPVFLSNGCSEIFQPSVLDIYGSDKPFRLSWNHSVPKENLPREVQSVMGCCQVFHKEWLSKVGGFMGITEPDNRDILFSLLTNQFGGRCIVAPEIKVSRRFGNPVRSRNMGKEMLKMAFLCLSHEDLNKFLVKYITSPSDVAKIASDEEIKKWMRIRMMNETI